MSESEPMCRVSDAQVRADGGLVGCEAVSSEKRRMFFKTNNPKFRVREDSSV